MKKLFTIACTLVLGSALSFAQATQTPPASGTTGTSTTGTSTTKSDTKTKKHSHSKKGGKKSKKSPGDGTATTPPK